MVFMLRFLIDGGKIYHWNDINQSWDGRGYNGREVEEGVYFYRMIT